MLVDPAVQVFPLGIVCYTENEESSDRYQELTGTSKQAIITRYLAHVTGYQPIRD